MHLVVAALALLSSSASGDSVPDQPEKSIETISIIGTANEVERIAGSAHQIDAATLEQLNYDDIHRVLKQVPGVYLRDEDGFGLRPNIGLRGANSDRSAKVSLMEDGVLFAPAPYAAPAAYYFPVVTRLVGVEVFKGPAAIRYGPHTIGGAINLLTRAIPEVSEGAIDIAAGSYLHGKLHGYWGTTSGPFGILVEGVRLQSEGFKALDGGGETGLGKHELMLKGQYELPAKGTLYHSLGIKLGYAGEKSFETYLGLTHDDFLQNPQRRYVASQYGLMHWWRTQGQLQYLLQVGKDFELRTVAYRHDLSRAWRKLNSFRGGPSMDAILSNPDAGQSAVFYSVLTGAQDSSNQDQQLIIGTNDRLFYSQGAQASARWAIELGPLAQELRFGVRFHQDMIRRLHTEDSFWMQSSRLVPSGEDTAVTTYNHAVAQAWSLYLHDTLTLFDDLTLTPGVRLELIDTLLHDRQTGEEPRHSYAVVLPGMGLHYQIAGGFGVLAGVHRGFSPVSPGQPEEVGPELSLNYELGGRLALGALRLDVIGFFNDYSNISGVCRFSAGCGSEQLETQFNGGAAHVYGLEVQLSHELTGPFGTRIGLSGAYTFTHGEFLSSFDSSFPQFGRVQAGDLLPYVPEHQAAAMLSMQAEQVGVTLGTSYTSAMRDVASQGAIEDNLGAEAHLLIDMALAYRPSVGSEIYLNIDNALNTQYIASRRPFGLRPGKPLLVVVGYKHHFDSE